jgi:hypothetical protein
MIKPHECGFWGRRNTRVMVFFGPGKPPPQGFPGQRPSRLCFCCLRNHTSVVLYLSHATKTTEKLLIPEFHTPSSPWRYADGATTSRRPVQQYAWLRMTSLRIPDYTDATGNPYYTYVVSDIFIPRSPDSTGQILLVFYEINRVGDSARKGILVCVF